MVTHGKNPHILTIDTARSGLNSDSDVSFGEPFLKLTKVLEDSFHLVFTWRSMSFTCCCFEGFLVNVALV